MARRSPSAWLRAAFPIVAQLESYRSEWFLRDVTAGLAIAAVALPVGVAYPAIAGLPPVVGLYASIKEVDDGIWIVSFMHYDLGFIDLEQKTLQPLDNPFGTGVVTCVLGTFRYLCLRS